MSARYAMQTMGQIFQLLAFGLLLVLSLTAIGYTVAAALGVTPWLVFTAQFGEFYVPQAGMIVQILVTVLLTGLLFFIPSNFRVMRLESAHRKFHIKMEDVARAYHHCHTADRAGVFTMSSEFDQVRERLAYLRDHPDLEQLESDTLEVAAQMSQQAKHLADVYSDEKVARARAFLTERQEEAERQQARIVEALHACTEIRKWTQQVEVEEAIVASQLERLEEQLSAALPALGYEFDTGPSTNVVPLPERPAAE